MKKSDFPADGLRTEPGEISTSVELANAMSGLKPIDINNPKEIADRIDWYFRFCVENDVRPVVMGLCLVLDVSRQTLINWEKQQNERGAIIRRAKNKIRYLIEFWTESGKLSPPVGIFWAKNLLGMSDNVTITAQSSDNSPRASLTPQEIAARIAEDVPVDEPEPEPLQIESGIF